MLRLWPGWLLCAATAGLYGYMFLHEGRAISELISLPLPDGAFLPYDGGLVAVWREAFIAVPEAASRYRTMHAIADTLAPPMLTLTIGFLGFAALYSRTRTSIAVVAGVLSVAAAVPYMLFDFRENATADALFSPLALASPMDPALAAALPGLTLAKYLTLYAALIFVLALWIWRWRQRARG